MMPRQKYRGGYLLPLYFFPEGIAQKAYFLSAAGYAGCDYPENMV